MGGAGSLGSSLFHGFTYTASSSFIDRFLGGRVLNIPRGHMVRCNGLVVMEMGNGVSALFYLQPHIFWRFGMFVDIFFRYIYNPLVCISDELLFQDHLSTRHLVCVYTFVVQGSHDLIPCTIILHLVQEIICTTLTDFHRHSTSQVQPFTPFIITPVLSSIMETQPSHPVQP